MTSIDDIQSEIETAYSATYTMRDEVENITNSIHSAVSKAITTLARAGMPEDEDVANAIEEAISLLEDLV